MISYKSHERPSSGEVLSMMKQINQELDYKVEKEELREQLQWRLEHQAITNQPMSAISSTNMARMI